MGPRRLDDIPSLPPFDLSLVKDEGAKALIMLAIGLGWNAIVRPGQPAKLTARDGKVVSVPTNTGLRIGVWQGCLSSIMTHTEPGFTVSPEYVDRLVKTFKVDREKERRIRNAIGESPEQQRERRAALREAPEPVVVLPAPDDEPAAFVDQRPPFLPTSTAPREIVSRKPAMARYQATAGGAKLYESRAADEITYSDGSKTYVCNVCDKPYPSLKAVASHRRVHTNAGEASPIGNMHRAETVGFDPTPAKPGSPRRMQRLSSEIEAALNSMDPRHIDDMTRSDLAHAIAAWIVEHRPDTSHHDESAEGLTPEQILNRIAVLVDRGRTVELMAQVESQQQRIDYLVGERRALAEMLREAEEAT